MEENKEEKIVNTDEIKKETVDTVSKVKDTIKDLKIKDETMNAKNFMKDMVKDPISKTAEISKDKDNKYLKTSVFLVLVWMVVELVKALFSYGSFASLFGFRTILSIIKTTLSPLCIVLTLTLIIFILNKKNKKSLTAVLSTVVTVYIPMVVSSLVSLLYLIDYQMGKITTPVSMLATFVTVILSYFAMRDLFEEETELGTFKKFVLVEAIYYGVAIVFSFLGISLYL